ncbi:DeoR family transcriptional regulator of aga operon [Pedobacter sp. UYEF25]
MKNLTERHQFILDRLQTDQFIQVVDLCDELKVSPVTIRKDLQLLENKGLLFRTHGGATQSNPYTVDIHFSEKEKLRATEKQKIGTVAANLLKENDSIVINSGTTVMYFAKSIPPLAKLTVLTPALNVALELSRDSNIEIIQLGGSLRHSSSSVTGSYAEQMLGDFFCNKLFLSVDGIDLEFGLTTTNAMEAQLNKKMVKSAQRTIVLADSSKFGRKGFGRICGIEEIDHIITDAGVSTQIVKHLETAGVKVTVV